MLSVGHKGDLPSHGQTTFIQWFHLTPKTMLPLLSLLTLTCLTLEYMVITPHLIGDMKQVLGALTELTYLTKYR